MDQDFKAFCNDCDGTGPGIGDHRACAFNVSDIYAARAGIYVKTSHICSGKPVYQKSDGDTLYLFEGSYWRISDEIAATNCVGSGGPSGSAWVESRGHCPESPDGVGCVGQWICYPWKTIDANITVKAC